MTTDKQQQKISLIENGNGATMPQIVKKTINGHPTPVHTETHNCKTERGKAFRQILAAFVANIGPMNTGLIFGFSAVVIPQLQSPASSIQINEDQASWVASLSSLSTPIGCILGGYLSDRIGRKKTLILTEIPLILGWLIIAFASQIEMIYIGRLLCGLGSGIVGAPARVYTSEVTQPHLRGMLTALSSVALSFGVLMQYTLGAFLSWQTLSAVSCIVPVFAFIGMCMLPETPNFLITHQKPEKALKSLTRLRGSFYNFQKEINQLQAFAEKTNTKKKPTGKEMLDALLAPSCLKPFFILVVYFMLYQFSGVNTITFYAVEIFRDSGADLDKNTATIILGALRFFFTIVGCVALRKCGRRPLSFISGIGCCITMLGLGMFMYYKQQCELQGIAPMHTWIPVACIFLFIITCTLGFLVVPWIMIGELYPMKVRGIVGGFTTCAAHSFVFIVVKTYPLLVHGVERHGAFIIYGIISFVATIFFYFYLPETKGKTLQEIEDYFSGHIASLDTKKLEKINNNLNNNITNNNNNQISLIMESEKLLNQKQ
jgi:sugar porter (SP) family MFS transporter